MSSLLFIDKVAEPIRDAFAKEVRRMARKYRINPNWLMGVMNSETGGSFDPAQKNYAGSGATGLIQFMPATARDLGTTTHALAKLSAVAQLSYVDRYLAMQMKNFGINRIKDYDDLYLMVFYPAYIGQPDTKAFPQSVYAQNKGVDVDSDGIMTIADFKAFIRKKIPPAYLTEFTARFRFLSPRYLAFLLVSLGLIALAVLVIRRQE